MKKISFLVFVLLILCISKLSAQDEYMKDHVIVYFHDGVLNKSLLVSDSRSFNRTELVAEKTLADSLDKWGIGSSFQKVVRNARPDKMVSTSRTGEEVPVPMLYNLVYVPVPEGEDALSLCKKLEALPFVIYAEPDYLMKIDDAPAPNDPHFNLQRGWEQANDRDIDLLRAWNFTRGSNAVRVGVIDTGIDYHNPDLGNGSFGTGNKVASGYDYEDDDSNPDDAHSGSHGTSVAGIIGALANNGTGVAGIAGGDATTGNMGVQLIALRVGESSFSIGNVVEAIYDATTSVNQGGFGCHILNYSGGGYTIYNSVRKAISYAVHNGVVFVASKGNNDTTNKHYPSDYADNLIISVGASNELDQRASFSNYGNNMDFVAPGTTNLLYTTKRVEQGSYGTFSGTSGAAPVVTGIAALLKSANMNLHRDDIENILQISAVDIVSDPNAPGQVLTGYDDYTGHGRVNAGRALELLHEPYVLQHHTTVGGTSQKITSGDGEGLTFLNDAGTTLPEGWYFGQKYEVTKIVDIPLSACNESYVWTRTVGATSGWSAANPNNNLGFSHIVSQTGSTLTLRTHVYYIKHNALGQTINAWHPVSPQNASIAYTTLTNMPVSSTISGPSFVCNTNSTFSLGSLPPGYSVAWGKSDNLTYVGGQSTTNYTVKAVNLLNSGEGWVEASISGPCGTVVLRKDVWVGTPTLTGLTYNGSSSLPDQVCKGKIDIFQAYSHSGYPGPVNYIWSGSNVDIVTDSSNTAWIKFTGSVGSYATVSVTAGGECGQWPGQYTWYGSIIDCGGEDETYRIYPNPASHEITISLNEGYAEAIHAHQDDVSITSLRVLDRMGTSMMVRNFSVRETSVQLNISSLPRGLYLVIINNRKGYTIIKE